MSEHFKAIVVREDGSMGASYMTFEDVQKAVGGYVEPIHGMSGVVALVNEDGLRLRLEQNLVASDYLKIDLVGVVVFAGNGGSEFTNAPEDVWNSLKAIQEGYYPPKAPEAVTDGSAAVTVLTDHEARLAEAAMVLREHGYQVIAPKPHTKPKVRSGAPDTSKAIEPKLNSALGKVLWWLRGTGPATDDELEQHLGLTHQSVSAARRNGVIRGLIYDSGEKRNTRSGNAAIVWKAVQ
jgi:hypothetical protein